MDPQPAYRSQGFARLMRSARSELTHGRWRGELAVTSRQGHIARADIRGPRARCGGHILPGGAGRIAIPRRVRRIASPGRAWRLSHDSYRRIRHRHTGSRHSGAPAIGRIVPRPSAARSRRRPPAGPEHPWPLPRSPNPTIILRIDRIALASLVSCLIRVTPDDVAQACACL